MERVYIFFKPKLELMSEKNWVILSMFNHTTCMTLNDTTETGLLFTDTYSAVVHAHFYSVKRT